MNVFVEWILNIPIILNNPTRDSSIPYQPVPID